MPKIGKTTLAVAVTGLLTGAVTATAPAASASASASAQPTAITAEVKPVAFPGYLSPADGTAVLGIPHDWVFGETPSAAYTIRTGNLPDAPCLTAVGDGQPVRLDPCRPGAGTQAWVLKESRQLQAFLIESAALPDEVLEAHGPGQIVTLEQTTDSIEQRWHLLVQ
ncbi:RICIN domain-containing protein [Kitasatospora griseola]|uniref:RICIN domain-containing protein n=1 Tax=Kitasatospora griseola TaxID=2064 RepID=UPI00341CCAC5